MSLNAHPVDNNDLAESNGPSPKDLSRMVVFRCSKTDVVVPVEKDLSRHTESIVPGCEIGDKGRANADVVVVVSVPINEHQKKKNLQSNEAKEKQNKSQEKKKIKEISALLRLHHTLLDCTHAHTCVKRKCHQQQIKLMVSKLQTAKQRQKSSKLFFNFIA